MIHDLVLSLRMLIVLMMMVWVYMLLMLMLLSDMVIMMMMASSSSSMQVGITHIGTESPDGLGQPDSAARRGTSQGRGRRDLFGWIKSGQLGGKGKGGGAEVRTSGGLNGWGARGVPETVFGDGGRYTQPTARNELLQVWTTFVGIDDHTQVLKRMVVRCVHVVTGALCYLARRAQLSKLGFVGWEYR